MQNGALSTSLLVTTSVLISISSVCCAQDGNRVIPAQSQEASSEKTAGSNPTAPAPVLLNAPIVVDGPLPTVAPTWGNILAWAGNDIVVTGPERIQREGFAGQIMTVTQRDGGWSPLREYAGIPDALAGDLMLQHFAAEANWLVANTEHANVTGDVVLFKRAESKAGWEKFARITAPPGMSEPLFGSALAMRGGVLAVGTTDLAIRTNGRTLVPAPRVHLFQVKDGQWTGAGFLQPPSDLRPMWFGCALEVAGDRVFVGCPQAYTPNPSKPIDAGGRPSSVFVYARGEKGWQLEQEIVPPPGCTDNAFGINLVSDGEVLVVRSSNIQAGQIGAQRSGATSLFVYRRGAQGWAYEGTLNPGPGTIPGAGIAFAMSMENGLVAVGDTSADLGTGVLGAVYVFAHDGSVWREVYRLAPSVAGAPGRFGVSVAIHGRSVAVGRVRSERDGIEPGGVYIYQLP